MTDALPELFVTVGVGARQRAEVGVRGDEPWLTTYPRLGDVHDSARSTCCWPARSDRHANAQPSTINTFVATNGASLPANYNVTSAILQTSNLARPLAPGLAFQTVDLTLPGQVYPDRVNSVDHASREDPALRRHRRPTSGIDFYNLFNANTGTAFNQVYDVVSNGASWLRPTTVLNPRFARFNVTLNF